MREMKTSMHNAVYVVVMLFVVVAASVISSGCTQPMQPTQPTQTSQNINVNIQISPTPTQDKVVDINVNGQRIHVETGENNKVVHIDQPGQAPIDVKVVNSKVNNSIQI
jgi:hypothetical protein